LGRTEENCPSARLESAASIAGVEEPARPEVAAGAVSGPTAAARANSMPAEEVAPAEAAMPPPPVVEVAAVGNDAATHASSDPPSQEGTCKAMAETTAESSTRAGSLEPPEPAGRTLSSPRPAPSVQAVMPTLGAGAGAADSLPLFGLASNSGGASQGPLATRVERSERGETPPAPKVATQDASRGRTPAAVAGSGVRSLSSASQLQQEWADTASSVERWRRTQGPGQ
jgi:hypothetical protein